MLVRVPALIPLGLRFRGTTYLGLGQKYIAVHGIDEEVVWPIS